MTGRGVDQILPSPCDPAIHEGWMTSARDYVALAEAASGPFPAPVGFDYIWGDALKEIDARAPDLRVINLETAITSSGAPEPKGINYRMHPGNAGSLTAARIDCCVLANNHVLDWGPDGLRDTLSTLQRAGIATTGAGRNAAEATAPAALGTSTGVRLLVFAYACPSSGVPEHWQAGPDRAGVSFLPELGASTLRRVGEDIRRVARPADIVMVSIHWGGNWGYGISPRRRSFAQALVDRAGVHIVHGHSSHHPVGIEIHAAQPILYGCGDLINDYEGIRGHEEYRADLVLGYFLDIDDLSRRLKSLEMVPFRVRRLRLNRAAPDDIAWLHDRLHLECRALASHLRLTGAGTFRVEF